MARARRDSRPDRPSTRTQRAPGRPDRDRDRDRTARHGGDAEKPRTNRSSQTSSQTLSIDSLAKLNALNEKGVQHRETAVVREKTKKKERIRETKRYHGVTKGPPHAGKERRYEKQRRRKRRVVSGPLLEEGRVARMRGGERRRSRRKKCWIFVGIIIVLLAIIIPVAVVVAGKNKGGGSATGAGGTPKNTELGSISQADIPPSSRGTILDPFTWYDTSDFNVTFTDEKVGDLPVIGLPTAFDDSTRASDDVPALSEPWPYGTRPIRGVNLGGWLSIEPFITPSLFSSYDPALGIVDEYTLTEHLGPDAAKQTLEKHYATFVTEDTLKDIAAAGLDHIRIPFSYWAVTTYAGDPFVPQISWRYLLRGIEWARKHGLRVKLDLHGAPGSQNGWNHSGRLGAIGWLNGTDGSLNGQRTLDIHDQLSKFFAQPRYKNIITIYGLLNEPKMTKLDAASVHAWTAKTVSIVQGNGITATIAVGDGFLGLPKWKGSPLAGQKNLVLDVHQYVIFNRDQLGFTHANKVKFACEEWGKQMELSSSPETGFGPTICGEWSQADTDCALYLNNVNAGSRWQGSFLSPLDPSQAVLSPACPSTPSENAQCDCRTANASPSRYSPEYKRFLLAFAEAQMQAFERGWGWFYWTWDTEQSVQWSWKKGVEAGILPKNAGERGFTCGEGLDLGGLEESY
ncbi:MAG: hypothetical protein M1817_003197 [Caeruleum heppii]|nr:MAG: hypothetical protein M1817_003197 [Caeruleum heppii]